MYADHWRTNGGLTRIRSCTVRSQLPVYGWAVMLYVIQSIPMLSVCLLLAALLRFGSQSDAHDVRQVAGFQLDHDLGTVDLHRPGRDAEILRDGFVR